MIDESRRLLRPGQPIGAQGEDLRGRGYDGVGFDRAFGNGFVAREQNLAPGACIPDPIDVGQGLRCCAAVPLAHADDGPSRSPKSTRHIMVAKASVVKNRTSAIGDLRPK
jgi:hypothetical protein